VPGRSEGKKLAPAVHRCEELPEIPIVQYGSIALAGIERINYSPLLTIFSLGVGLKTFRSNLVGATDRVGVVSISDQSKVSHGLLHSNLETHYLPRAINGFLDLPSQM
jgi:hypothetical protein